MGVVDDPIEYGVGECRFADDIVSCLDGQPAGEQDRAGAVALFDDFHEIAPLRRGQPVGAPIVEDQQVGADELPEQAREASIAMGELEFGEEARQATVKDGPAVATGLLTESAGEPCLADTGQASDGLPAFRNLKCGFIIRSILGRDRWCRWSRGRLMVGSRN